MRHDTLFSVVFGIHSSADPLQPLVLRLLRAQASTTLELYARIVEEEGFITLKRLALLLRGLRKTKLIDISQNCDIRSQWVPVRKEWRISP